MSLSMKENQRVLVRKILRTRDVIEDEFSDEFLYFLSTDISTSGIFIESKIQLQNLTKLFLKFSLYEGDRPIQVTGEVTRMMEPKRGQGRRKKREKLGIGIRFLGLDHANLRRIEKFIHS